jgi:outer membrane protein, heavy metal efflux system
MHRTSFQVSRTRSRNQLASCLPWLGLLLLAFARPAGAAETLTLDRALELARSRNPQLLAVRQDREVAGARLEKARYWNPFNPEVEGGGATRQFDGGGSATQPSAGASIEIEVAGQRGLRIAEAERHLARVDAEIADAERQLTAQVEEAFYQILYLRERLRLLRDVEELNRRLRDAAEARFKSGEVAKLENNLAVVRYSQSRKETLAGQRDYQNGVRALERLLGMEPIGSSDPRGELNANPIAVHEETLVERAVQQRPDLRAREVEIQRVDADTSLTKRLIVPNPTVRGFYDQEVEQPGMRDQIIGGQISIPLPVFDRKQAELTALAAQRTQAGYERTATELAVVSEVRDAYRSYTAAREALELFEKDARGLIAESFRFVETSYRAGKIDLLQLVVVENDLVASRLSYLDTQRDYWTARIALERAVGQPLEEGTDR